MDGMAKVTNRTMEQLLRIHAMTNGWVATLPLVAMMINAMPQSRTGRMPHEVAYGWKLRMPMDMAIVPMDILAAEEYAGQLHRLWREVRERMAF